MSEDCINYGKSLSFLKSVVLTGGKDGNGGTMRALDKLSPALIQGFTRSLILKQSILPSNGM